MRPAALESSGCSGRMARSSMSHSVCHARRPRVVINLTAEVRDAPPDTDLLLWFWAGIATAEGRRESTGGARFAFSIGFVR